jgi:hypothetical protein
LFIQIKEKKYIVLYGGQEWNQKFASSAKSLVDDPKLIQKKISIEFVQVKMEDLGLFSTNIENLFLSKV